MSVGFMLKVFGNIGVDFGGGGNPGTCPPIIEKRPCIYQFSLPPSAPQYFGFPTQYF